MSKIVFVKASENNYLNESIQKGIYTNPYRNDGLGEHVKNILNSIMFAKIHKLKYVYTPMVTVEHNYNNDSNFISRIEDMLGIRSDYEISNVEGLQREFRFDDSGRLNDLFVSNMNKLHTFKEYHDIVSKIRDRHKYDDYFDLSFFNIVVHIRRSNPNDTKNYDKDHKNDYLNYQLNIYRDDFYVKLIKSIYEKYTKESTKPVKIHIHSQDLNKEYYDQNLKNVCVEYHLYEEQTKAFVSMFLCDILVTAPSNFSYTAALIKTTGVIYLKFFYPPMQTWYTIK